MKSYLMFIYAAVLFLAFSPLAKAQLNNTTWTYSENKDDFTDEVSMSAASIYDSSFASDLVFACLYKGDPANGLKPRQIFAYMFLNPKLPPIYDGLNSIEVKYRAGGGQPHSVTVPISMGKIVKFGTDAVENMLQAGESGVVVKIDLTEKVYKYSTEGMKKAVEILNQKCSNL